MSLESIQEEYETGQKIFEQLFKLSDKELKDKLKSILRDHEHPKSILLDKPDITREIYNEKPHKITISFYDSIELGAFGLWYKPEHGLSKKLRTFDKHFVL